MAILSVAGDGEGNVVVTFSGPVSVANVQPAWMSVDIDPLDVGSQTQVSANQLGFTCGSSYAGTPWVTELFFYFPIPAGSGVVIPLI